MLDRRVSPAFTSSQVLRLMGVSRRKLDYWIHTDLIKPDIERGAGRGRVRLYSFQNLVEIRTVAWLRDKVSLQLIRAIVRRLREHPVERPLTGVTFGVVDRARPAGRSRYDVVMRMPDGTWEASRYPGQLVMEVTIPIDAFAAGLRERVERDRRTRRRIGRIERRRGALGSSSVLAGTRVPTRAIASLSEAGYSVQDIMANYPGLTERDIAAALEEEHRRSGRSARRRRSA